MALFVGCSSKLLQLTKVHPIEKGKFILGCTEVW